ncbi:glucosamine-6-phosphate deaminase [Kineosporia rhizophila]|uniref:glucosamine-6-phosphate deaminase n=1 Tax=Kineosporia TaxID=49184 RepID=UPI001E5580FD|nr:MULTISPECIES: glucosamine-6-phosphate deaminase [Kineosporia]MCE0538865.1 glucosamine-6-phosphate deaminase [Kineosporia rhizophila]GLY18783.1 glucosamine-6-phosphate deaminase [Kineosporia sp. NBRC 101677]
MEVIVLPTATETAALAADIIETLLRTGAEPVIGLATGSTPQPLYQELTRRHKEAGLSFAHARAFMLDEYVGLPEDHPERYAAVIQREVTDRLDIPPAAVQGPNGAAADPVAECARYEQAIIDAGGIDVQIAGIGSNGHIAFNEPGSALTSLTRPKTLNARTRQDNARFFSSLDEVPRHVLTQGLGTIGRSRHLLMLASGEGKAEAVAHAVEGPLSAVCPASIVQLHRHATVLLDEPAAGRLQLREYYDDIWANRPDWQPL